jgi:hypothetical protein
MPMVKIGKRLGGDLQTNMSMGAGRLRCHSNLDLLTTCTGDLAITATEESNMRQRLFMWLATPKGERLDPSVGCCLYDFMHDKATSSNARLLEIAIGSDIQTLFPELAIKTIRCRLSDADNRTFYVDIKIGNESLSFLFDYNELLNFSSQIAELFSVTG